MDNKKIYKNEPLMIMTKKIDNFLNCFTESSKSKLLKIKQNGSSQKVAQAKIKAFRSKFRGVRNIEFFLFRLTNLYA